MRESFANDSEKKVIAFSDHLRARPEKERASNLIQEARDAEEKGERIKAAYQYAAEFITTHRFEIERFIQKRAETMHEKQGEKCLWIRSSTPFMPDTDEWQETVFPLTKLLLSAKHKDELAIYVQEISRFFRNRSSVKGVQVKEDDNGGVYLELTGVR